MIYEILVRGNNNKQTQSDNLIWIESDLPTRTFEKWLITRNLLGKTSGGAIVRWGIVQTQRPAHFVLASQEKALEKRIANLLNPTNSGKKAKQTDKEATANNFATNNYSIAA